MVRKKLSEVDFLRAIASLAVALFHLCCGNIHLFPRDNILKKISSHGYLGVEIFFMLSGFIICYSLSETYKLKNFKQFIIRRILRIEPPYIISIFLLLALNALSFKITGISNPVNWPNILLHFAYLNNFGFGNYINDVYWTLGIEFQFYLIIAMIFPFIKTLTQLTCVLIIFSTASLIPVPDKFIIITPFLPIFGLGILIYFYKIRNLIDYKLFFVITSLSLMQIYVYLGFSTFLACVFCILILLFWTYKHSLITFFSSISFSLYLTHTFIGGKVINLGLRFANTDFQRIALFLVALIVSIVFAYIFHILIEKPSLILSKKMKYTHK